jgi:hypothetical protein
LHRRFGRTWPRSDAEEDNKRGDNRKQDAADAEDEQACEQRQHQRTKPGEREPPFGQPGQDEHTANDGNQTL